MRDRADEGSARQGDGRADGRVDGPVVLRVSGAIGAQIGAPPGATPLAKLQLATTMPAAALVAVPAPPATAAAPLDAIPAPRDADTDAVPAAIALDREPTWATRADDARSFRCGDQLAVVHRRGAAIISRRGTLGQRGAWRIVDYPSPTLAAHAYALECSRLVAEGFHDVA